MQVCILSNVITVTWASRSPVLDARARVDLRQSADAWMDTLAAMMLRPAPVSARVQAASALLGAGFDSVAVSSNGVANLHAAMAERQALAA